MSFLGTIQNWPEKKKRNFSILLASILTVVIIVSWFAFNPAQKGSDAFQSAYASNQINALKDSFQKFLTQFQLLKGQIASTTKALIQNSTSTTPTAASTTLSTTTTKQ